MSARLLFCAMLAAAAASLVGPVAIAADTPSRPYQVGFIGHFSPGLEWRMLAAFQRRLRELGWIEGETIEVTYRWADGQLARHAAIAGELARSSDVVVAPCGPAIPAVRAHRPTLPVVARCTEVGMISGDAYTTGVTYFSPAATRRRLELLGALVPGLARVALLYRPGTDWAPRVPDVEAAARGLGLKVYRAPWDTLGALALAMDDARLNADAIMTLGDGRAHAERERIFAMAAERRIPVLYDFPMFPSPEGGLASYHPTPEELFEHVAEQVDWIARGTRPQDLAVRTPKTLRLTINRRQARELGLRLSPALLRSADLLVD